MVRLDQSDRLTLLRTLEGVAELASERGRRQTLVNAGLGSIATHLDLGGSPSVALGEIVEGLCNYGRITPEAEALGVLLNWIKTSVGLEQQASLSALMTKYQMMVPVVIPPVIPNWRSTATNAQVTEKIIGENTLRSIAFLEEGQRVARSVAYIGTNDGTGTGFLVSPNILLTNYHVLPDGEDATAAVFRFNYQNDWSGRPRQVTEVPAKKGGLFLSDQELDCAFIELEGTPGNEWGWLSLGGSESTAKKGDRINIIQHPGGQEKKISLQNNIILYLETPLLQYVTSTLPGSSGSPVFNDRWRPIGLHHAGGLLLEPRTGEHYFRNEAILIAAILDRLPVDLRRRLTA